MRVAAPATSPAAFRRRFPALGQTVHLASCGLAARSDALDAALARMLDAMSAGAAAWHEFEAEAERCRVAFAALVGADPQQIALLPNASTGAYQVVSTLDLGERDTVVTSAEEFPSIAHVWLAQRRRGGRVRFADAPAATGAGAEADEAAYAATLDARTALVSVPLVTYSRSAILPVAAVAGLAHDRGARVFVDAYQAVGVRRVDVAELDCDFLVAGAGKYLLGLPGIAFLYVRRGTDHNPSLTGWFGRADPFAFDARRLDFATSARRYEIGTPDVAALYGATAGMSLLAELDSHEIERHVDALTALAADRLRASGERVAPIASERRGAHVALADDDPARLGAWLSRRGISVSPRRPFVRLAFHYFNDERDVDAVCAAIEAYRARP
jgi:selenocysteine lyase/cysteine desulfurase